MSRPLSPGEGGEGNSLLPLQSGGSDTMSGCMPASQNSDLVGASEIEHIPAKDVEVESALSFLGTASQEESINSQSTPKSSEPFHASDTGEGLHAEARHAYVEDASDDDAFFVSPKPSTKKRSAEAEAEVEDSDYQEEKGDDQSSLHSDFEQFQESENELKPKAAKKGVKKTRRAAAKTPREYFKRYYEDQAKKPDVRKVGRTGTKKRRPTKSANQARPSVDGETFFQELLNCDPVPSDNDDSDREMDPIIQASTKKGQQDELSKLIARNPDIDMHKTGLSARQLVEKTKAFGRGVVKAANGKWLVGQMNHPLEHYQIVGVWFMLSRELSPTAPFGGILADTMGLGKTVQTIALIVTNPPPEATPSNQGQTLIIVPPALLLQWESEIGRHASEILKRVLIWRSNSQYRKKAWEIEAANVVLTTYWEVFKSCPFPDKATQALMKKEYKEDYLSELKEWINNNRETGDDLHKWNWYRVICDESQAIKNQDSATSIAVNTLLKSHAWALSGTPVMNRLEEFYPYFTLVGFPTTTSFEAFRQDYCDPHDKRCARKLSQHLPKFMLRRTMHDKMFGRRIMVLKKIHRHSIQIKSTIPERILYREIEAYFRRIMCEFLEKGDPERNLSFLIVQATRLRQLTAHPLLIERQIKIMFTTEDFQVIQAKIRSAIGPGHPLDERISGWIDEKILEPEKTLEEYRAEQKLCQICHEFVQDPVTIKIKGCLHTFCELCINALAAHQFALGDADSTCPVCSTKYDVGNLIPLLPPKKKTDKSAKNKYIRGKDTARFIPAIEPVKWLEICDAEKVPLYQSGKLDAAIQQVKDWRQEAPEDNIIIFVQWRPFAVLLGRALESEKEPFLYFASDMSTMDRASTIEEFRTNDRIRVMVASLKCGGVGLNLQFANRAINVDLWWNTCIENQALGRIYRKGQKKETYFVRLIMPKTIDARLLKMQDEKNENINGALQDDRTVSEYCELFGRVVRDENGKCIRIEADYDSDLEDDDEDDPALRWENPLDSRISDFHPKASTSDDEWPDEFDDSNSHGF